MSTMAWLRMELIAGLLLHKASTLPFVLGLPERLSEAQARFSSNLLPLGAGTCFAPVATKAIRDYSSGIHNG